MAGRISDAISFQYNRLFKGHERSARARKNILFSIIIKGLSIGVSLVLVPLTIHYVNETRYGIWLTLSSIIGWFSFFDIGFGNGLRNKFAEAVARGEHTLARIYVSTTYAILSIIIAVILLIFFIVNHFLDWSRILNTPSGMAEELSILALIVFVFFCIQFVMQLIVTLITANQEPAKASLLGFLGSIFSLLTIYILTRTTKGNLIYLGTVFSVSPVIVYIISSVWFYNSKYKRYAPSFKLINFRYAKDLMNLGLKFFVIQIASIVIYQTSNIIIAQLFGPAQVTPYNIAYKYFSVVPMGFGIIMMPFWSAFTEAWIKEDLVWIRNVMNKLMKFWGLTLAAVFVMYLFADFIYGIWVGVTVSGEISLVMALYVALNSWCSIFSQFLNGVGKIKLQLFSGFFSAVINIPLAIFLGKKFGISGVVLSTCILALISSVWSPIQYRKLINGNARGIWNK